MISYEYDIFGWYVGKTNSTGGRTTQIVPPNSSLQDVPGVFRSNWNGSKWVEKPYVHRDEGEYLANLAMAKASIPARLSVSQQQDLLEGLVTRIEQLEAKVVLLEGVP